MVEHVLLPMCVVGFPETDFLKLFEGNPSSEAFLCHGISDNTAFCLGEKQGMLVNDERSSWYNRVGNCFSISLG